MTNSHTEVTAVREAAAGWRLRLLEDSSVACRTEFYAWLRASPLHMWEYLSVWATYEELASSAKAGRLDAWLLDPNEVTNVIALPRDPERAAAPRAPKASNTSSPWGRAGGEWPAPPSRGGRSPRARVARLSWSRTALYAGALVVAVTFGVRVLYLSHPHAYSTSTEQRSVVLPDHSQMTLNADTVAVVRFSDHERVVRLVAGDAFFAVAPDTRQFTILAGTTTVRAGGTREAVHDTTDNTAATIFVLDGKVTLSPVADTLPANQGQVAVITAPAGVSTLLSVSVTEAEPTSGALDRKGLQAALPDLKHSLCWRSAPFEFHGITLATLAEAINRCSPRSVRVLDERIAQRRLSGQVSLEHPEGLMNLLENDPSVSLENDPTGFVIRSRFDPAAEDASQ